MPAPPPAATPTATPRLDRDQLVAVLVQEGSVSPADAQEMVTAVENGDNLAEFFGLSAGMLANMENCAVAYYRGKRYAEAQQAFAALVYLTQERSSSAWRGLAACLQVQHYYEDAARSYAQALVLNPKDSLSAAHCGECLCLAGRKDEGVALLTALLQEVAASERNAPHVQRARALLAAGGGPGTPAPSARTGAPVFHAAQASHDNDANEGDALDLEALGDGDVDGLSLMQLAELNAELAIGNVGEIPDAGIRAQLADDETRARLQAIAEAVQNKELTVRMLADFSDEQMDAAHAVGCLHLERGETLQALQVAMSMLYVDAHDTRFYQLAGLCAHALRLYCLADYLYSLVGIWREGGADAATLIYQGEAKMLADEVDAGMALVRDGIQRAQHDPQLTEHVRRGEALLLQGASMARQQGSFAAATGSAT